MNEKSAKELTESAVQCLEDSTPDVQLDNTRVVFYDEIAFMCGKWIGVKSRPLASANFLEHLGPKSKKYRKSYETSANLIPNLRTSQNDNNSKI